MPEHTLLIVDDEPSILSALRRILRREGYKLLTASSGEEAQKTLSSEQVDMLLTDCRMPGMSGIELTKKVKVSHPDMIRIILSGYTDVGEAANAINDGEVYRFILKPWNDEDLKFTLRHAFEHQRLSDENVQLYQRVKEQNEELRKLNSNLEQTVEERTRELQIRNNILLLSQEILDQLPVAVVGIGADETVVQVNRRATERLLTTSACFGANIDACLPEDIPMVVRQTLSTGQSYVLPWTDKDRDFTLMCYPLRVGGDLRGVVVAAYELMTENVV